jgi:hypothetical protein
MNKLEYVIPNSIPDYHYEFHPEWVELVTLYFKYLDENVYSKYQNLVNVYNQLLVDSEYVDLLFSQYAANTIDDRLIELTEEIKKSYITISKLINNLKGTSVSFDMFLDAIKDANYDYDNDGVATKITDLGLKIYAENSYAQPFYYRYEISNLEHNTTFLDNNLAYLVKNIHPAGFYYTKGISTASYSEVYTQTATYSSIISILNKYNGVVQNYGVYSSNIVFMNAVITSTTIGGI